MENVGKKIFSVTVFIVTVCLGFFCYRNKSDIEIPVKKDLTLDSPYLIRDYGNLRYILDKQRTRILVVNRETNVAEKILPDTSSSADVFYCADDFLVDENSNVYVKEGNWDGNRIGREALIVYDAQGKYVKTCLDTTYSTLVNKHKIMLLSIKEGLLRYAIKEKNCISVKTLNLSDGSESGNDYPFDNAFDFINDMAEDPSGKIYALDKPGNIFELTPDGKVNLLYTADKNEFPNWIESFEEGTILFADLYNDCVTSLNLSTGKKSTVIEKSSSVTVTPLAFSELTNPQKNKSFICRQICLFVLEIAFIISALCLLIIVAVTFVKSKMHAIKRITVYIVLTVVVVSGTITYKLTGEFSKVMRSQILAQMENMAYSVANTIKPGTLDSIQSASDFASPQYREMIANMENVIDPNLDVNHNVYCDIFKYDDIHGAYAVAYLDQTIGTYFPLTPTETEEIKEIYRTGQAIRSSKDDTSASYTYVSVPVIDDQLKVKGVVSVMLESMVLSNQISEMRKNVLIGIVITLIFVWLLMGEALSFILSKSQARMEAEEKISRGEIVKPSFPYYYIRLMVFALFATYNMTTTFIPMVVVKGAVESMGENVSGFISALPLSINLFALGLMALFCEGFIRRAGCKKIIIIGAVLSALGNLLIFIFPASYLLIFIALTIDGIGVGLTTNSLYLMVSQIPDSKNRTSGFTAYNAAQVSGINFGMLFGAALASSVGRLATFPIVSVMWIVSALIFVLLWRTLKDFSLSPSQNTEEDKSSTKKIISFLFKPRVWSFIIFVQIPFALMASFVYYYLPIFSDESGMSEILVAVLMMLYSMFAIYLGNTLTKFVMKRLPVFSPYAGIFLCVIAVLIYAFNASFIGLLIAIFILGLANGFGRTVHQANFSMLEECESVGIPNAMGIFNFTDFIGQSFGPTVMALVFMSKDMKLSSVIFAGILLLVSVIHAIMNRQKK